MSPWPKARKKKRRLGLSRDLLGRLSDPCLCASPDGVVVTQVPPGSSEGSSLEYFEGRRTTASLCTVGNTRRVALGEVDLVQTGNLV